MEQALVTVTNLHYTINEGRSERPVLKGVNLSVSKGEAIALLGRSGSGKSTLLNLISGIDRPASGEIRIGEHSIGEMGEPNLTLFRRKEIGFIYQFFHLITTLTVAENIALPLELNGWSTANIRVRVEQLLNQVELTDYRQRFPDQLSGGEQQRVAIARAIAHHPNLLLADEPTGNLDAQIGRDVMQMLNRLVEKEGVTLILVTHSQSVAKDAQRILTLEDGHLAERTGEFAW